MDIEQYAQLNYGAGTPAAQQAVLSLLEACKNSPRFDGPSVARILDHIFDIQWEDWDTFDLEATQQLEGFVDYFWSLKESDGYRVCSSLIFHAYMFSKIGLLSSAIHSSSAVVADDAYRTIHSMTHYEYRARSVFVRINTLLGVLEDAAGAELRRELSALRDLISLSQGNARAATPDVLPIFHAGELIRAVRQDISTEAWIRRLVDDLRALYIDPT